MMSNPAPLGHLSTLKKCKHGVYGLCTLCAYKNTGRRKSTDRKCEQDVVEFMESTVNRQLGELNQ